MSNDRYRKPIIRAICKQGDAVHFFTGYEVPVPGEDYGLHWQRPRKNWVWILQMSRSQS